jgi:hypothetical protein
MSVIDLLTDENYLAIISAKEDEIRNLQAINKYLRDDRDRLLKFSQRKTSRIISLTEEIAELKAKSDPCTL